MVQVVEHVVCECCMLRIENDDESSCRHYHGHDARQHPRHDGSMWVNEEDRNVVWHKFTCDACGGHFLPGCNTFAMSEFIV